MGLVFDEDELRLDGDHGRIWDVRSPILACGGAALAIPGESNSSPKASLMGEAIRSGRMGDGNGTASAPRKEC